jgi:hypothetical protein
MRPRSQAALGSTLATVALACCAAAAAPAASPVSVKVPPAPSATGNVTISFRPRAALPSGGYYYAVVVLTRYAGYSATAPPPCATSSDMRRTVYGFPRRGRRVALTLIPAKSTAGGWCPGGVYRGALYAVPHRPICRGSTPCYGSSAEYGPCWQVEGHPVCGVVVKPEPKPEPPKQPEPPPPPKEATYYSYPGGLPRPVDHISRIVGRFTLQFPVVATG